ncbi:MAG: Acetyl-CoA hydrolase/N-acetyltransferase GNAT family fusion protein [Methanothrix sp.]|jgi:acyl-CoA hydrolase/GNAT superfamily N-acetyltransferase|nr:MAG: Acetyl-CoA hydrolase/N-acetyltransferase GNAT family fusion protein [Methanothrix sp.]
MGSQFEVDGEGRRRRHPDDFLSAEEADGIFEGLRSGARIFIGTACGEPQALVGALLRHIRAHEGDLFDLEILQIWGLGRADFADGGFGRSFRHNLLFVGEGMAAAFSSRRADYTPTFLSAVPDLIRDGTIPIDLALVQTSLADADGNVSLGISVDAVLAAVEEASIVAAQANQEMPRVGGDGIVNIREFDRVVRVDEPLLELVEPRPPPGVMDKIGRNVARIIPDGATIQVGRGGVPDAALFHLRDKKHLGLHSELFTDGAAELMRSGAIDNSKKTIDAGKAVASFSVGRRSTYDFIDENPQVAFRTIDRTSDPSVIARQRGMTALNTALEIDLTGQGTAESLGGRFCGGVGGEAEFIRGAGMAAKGRPILALPSTGDGGSTSRIVPRLGPGASATFHRCDVRYVVTEYGIADLRGKSVRDRAMSLIGISHPDFRPWLVEEAKRLSLVYQDQVYHPALYREDLEAWRATGTGLSIFLRPVRISDEPLLKEFFYSLSDRSLYRRFASARKDMPHSRIQEFVTVDLSRDVVILGLIFRDGREHLIGFAQYNRNERDRLAELAVVVRDDYQRQGVGTLLHSYMTDIAKKSGIAGFTAEVLEDNLPALRLIEKMGFETVEAEGGAKEMRLIFDA